MNELLLSNFNNNENLSELLLNYQEYFNFVKNGNNSVSLYLNTSKLKEYLIQGKDIKYRKFIFLFLENIYQHKKNKNYQFYINEKENGNIINKNLTKQDIGYIHKLINIKKHFQNNSIQLKNRNIIYLKNDIYIHLKNVVLNQLKKKKALLQHLFSQLIGMKLELHSIDNNCLKQLILRSLPLE